MAIVPEQEQRSKVHVEAHDAGLLLLLIDLLKEWRLLRPASDTDFVLSFTIHQYSCFYRNREERME